ncbi:MAG: hypothetical protein U1E85_06815 [Rhodocyclaceae bacterium]
MNTVTTVITREPRSLSLLSGAFAFFNALRIIAYLPTLLAIHAEGQTDQHSLLTWLCFLGANATMAMWLYEQNGHRMNRAISVSACNAVMCAAIAASIAWLRWACP